jgi:hypothetical protein
MSHYNVGYLFKSLGLKLLNSSRNLFKKEFRKHLRDLGIENLRILGLFNESYKSRYLGFIKKLRDSFSVLSPATKHCCYIFG